MCIKPGNIQVHQERRKRVFIRQEWSYNQYMIAVYDVAPSAAATDPSRLMVSTGRKVNQFNELISSGD